jgi:hypothetical protein
MPPERQVTVVEQHLAGEDKNRDAIEIPDLDLELRLRHGGHYSERGDRRTKASGLPVRAWSGLQTREQITEISGQRRLESERAPIGRMAKRQTIRV